MNPGKSRLVAWTNTLVTTAIAVALVGAFVVAGSYLMSVHRSLLTDQRDPVARNDAQVKKSSSRTQDDRAKTRDLARRRKRPSVIVQGETDDPAQGEPATPAVLTEDRPARPTPGEGPTDQDRPVKEKKTPALVARTPAERKSAEGRWQKRVEALHLKGLHAKGADAKAKRDRAEAELDAIDDPAAAPAIWRSFAGMHAHHLLAAQMLAGIGSAETSRMLAFLSVFSDDQKARFAAKNALRPRALGDYGESLISVIRPPLAYRRDFLDIPGAGRANVLLVESERACYQFVYPPASRPQAAGPANVYGPGNSYLDPAQRTQAQMINQQLAQEARASIDFQIQSVIEQVTVQNAQIKEQTDRALGVLRDISGTSHGPDREEWRRWLAGQLNITYAPLPKSQKQLVSQVVPHLYEPAFLNVPAPC